MLSDTKDLHVAFIQLPQTHIRGYSGYLRPAQCYFPIHNPFSFLLPPTILTQPSQRPTSIRVFDDFSIHNPSSFLLPPTILTQPSQRPTSIRVFYDFSIRNPSSFLLPPTILTQPSQRPPSIRVFDDY